jgi:thiosulfate/3-mercaptopyruvate sulfurtransferase
MAMKSLKLWAMMTLLGLLHAATAAETAAIAPLVDAEWARQNSCNPGVVVIDTRNMKIDGESKFHYLRGHIPCAVHSDYAKDGWRMKVEGIPEMLPPVDKLEKLIGGLGIDNETHVVIAGAGKQAKDFATAARIYWTFKVLGHDRVSILDGGTAAYAAEKTNPMEKGEQPPQAKIFKGRLQTAMLVKAGDLSAALEEGILPVDYRSSDMYLGINKSGKVKRSGTLPGAVNLPRTWLTVNNKGKLRLPGALRELYAAARVPTEGKQIAFCNTGHDAAIGWFVSSEILGNKEVKLYDGSLAEWSVDPGRPMESRITISD